MSDATANKRMIRIGMLTPSSNTVLEPVTTAMLSGLDDVSVHFSRFRVTAIGLDDAALAQFDDRAMLEAAGLLADAKVDVIAWNGTSAGWLGLDKDRRLCEKITAETGIAASTSVLSLFDIMRARGESRIGLVTPYTADVQEKIIARFADEGVDVAAEAHFGLRDNFSFATVSREQLAAAVEAVGQSAPQAISILCTNLAGAPLVDGLEKRFSIPIHDSIATTVWGALVAAGQPPSRVAGYGALFAEGAA
ncbi:aspartate/glutamate racemase family protein [Martelella sp. HB161492]|uniref:maleate cis-trans isomerase family protein n=1 Tax=Martelella sp. HB161492 TaxID=2720726 RepID=UPI001FEDC820|nr:aspartate/glutamate racemase family protein [Martelella sp. HB161492]